MSLSQVIYVSSVNLNKNCARNLKIWWAQILKKMQIVVQRIHSSTLHHKKYNILRDV